MQNNAITNTSTTIPNTNRSYYNKSSFRFLYIIGEGGFCKVYKAKHNYSHKSFAIKETSKLTITSPALYHSIMLEQHILSHLYNPFITNMYCSFQDTSNLYLVLDYCKGGDLRYFTAHRTTPFTENQIIANITFAIEYIHKQSIIHCDIKPENVLCDEYGYFHLSDFGVAKTMEGTVMKCRDIAGTPGYIPPEALKGVLSYEYDYFSLGVIVYELMLKELPGKTRVLAVDKVPNGFHNKELICDFVNGLLCKDRDKRLGRGGAVDIKQHPWIKEYDWNGVKMRKVRSEFVPKGRGVCYGNGKGCKGNGKLMLEEEILRDKTFQQQFKEYNCVVRNVVKDDYTMNRCYKRVMLYDYRKGKSNSPCCVRGNAVNNNNNKYCCVSANRTKILKYKDISSSSRNDISIDNVKAVNGGTSRECKRILLPWNLKMKNGLSESKSMNKINVCLSKQKRTLKKCSSDTKCQVKCETNGNERKLPRIEVKGREWNSGRCSPRFGSKKYLRKLVLNTIKDEEHERKMKEMFKWLLESNKGY